MMDDEIKKVLALTEEYIGLIPEESLITMEFEQKNAKIRLEEMMNKMSRFPNLRFIELCELYKQIKNEQNADEAFEVAVAFQLWDEAKKLQTDDSPSKWHEEFVRLVDDDAGQEEQAMFIGKVMDSLKRKVTDFDYSGLANDVSCAISFL